MKIFFSCTTAEFMKYRDYYFSIREFLINQNHILTRDWLPHTEDRIKKNELEYRDVKEVYSLNIKALKEAEILIVEDTVSNFSTGHLITLALQWQKPVLVLWLKEKHKHFKSSFINGINSEYLEVKEYDPTNYKDIINTFIKKYENATKKNRFHLVLDEVERKYLDWAQYSKSKSRTKLIREAIRKYINEDDEYQSYLKR